MYTYIYMYMYVLVIVQVLVCVQCMRLCGSLFNGAGEFCEVTHFVVDAWIGSRYHVVTKEQPSVEHGGRLITGGRCDKKSA